MNKEARMGSEARLILTGLVAMALAVSLSRLPRYCDTKTAKNYPFSSSLFLLFASLCIFA